MCLTILGHYALKSQDQNQYDLKTLCDRQTDRQTGRQTDRQTDRDRKTDSMVLNLMLNSISGLITILKTSFFYS